MYHTLSFNLTNRQWGNLPNSSSNLTRSNSNSFNSMHSNSSNSNSQYTPPTPHATTLCIPVSNSLCFTRHLHVTVFRL